jgi:hypothetical protein
VKPDETFLVEKESNQSIPETSNADHVKAGEQLSKKKKVCCSTLSYSAISTRSIHGLQQHARDGEMTQTRRNDTAEPHDTRGHGRQRTKQLRAAQGTATGIRYTDEFAYLCLMATALQ